MAVSLPLQTINVFGSYGGGSGEFNRPSGVAVSDGEIFIADCENDRIQVFNMSGQYQRDFTVNCSGEIVKPCGVAFTREDHLAIVGRPDKERGKGPRICVCDIDGIFLRQFGNNGELSGPNDVAFTRDGHAHVVDVKDNCVKTFAPDGKLVRTIGREKGRFYNPYSVTIDSEDRMIVSDGDHDHIHVFNPDGDVLLEFGRRGMDEGLLKWPLGVTVDQSRNIIVCDCENNRVQMFSPDGDYIDRVDDPSDEVPVKWPRAITTVLGHSLKFVLTELNKPNKHYKCRIIS